MTTAPRLLALVAILGLGACDSKIDARSIRLVGAAELSSLLPPHFQEDEGVRGKLVGVVIQLDGRDLRKLAGGSRNPEVHFVNCTSGNEVGSSFGPFAGGDYARSYVRKQKVNTGTTYSLLATALPDILERDNTCVRLEARWYTGVVAESARLPLPRRS
jgi:hypothetical protein